MNWVEISLETARQFHRRKEFANDLISELSNRRGANGILSVRKNDIVQFYATEIGAEENVFWIHVAKSRPSLPTEVELKITVSGAGCSEPGGRCQTINRVIFYIPVFETPPPMTCERENTFQIRSHAAVNAFMTVENMESIGVGALLE
jgi:hypothetical protein